MALEHVATQHDCRTTRPPRRMRTRPGAFRIDRRGVHLRTVRTPFAWDNPTPSPHRSLPALLAVCTRPHVQASVVGRTAAKIGKMQMQPCRFASVSACVRTPLLISLPQGELQCGESCSALTCLAGDEDGDVTDRDTGPGCDAFPRGHFDRGRAAGASDPTDLGNSDHPSVRIAADFDIEVLTDHRATHTLSDTSGTAVAQGSWAPQSGLNSHRCFSREDNGRRESVMR